VAPVLGLIPGALARAVEHLLGDLLTGVRGQAVQRDRPGRGEVEQRVEGCSNSSATARSSSTREAAG
jgi:hypothetical protein